MLEAVRENINFSMEIKKEMVRIALMCRTRLLKYEHWSKDQKHKQVKETEMNIFDNMSDETPEFESNSQARNTSDGTFTVQFGTEAVQVAFRSGMTIKDAFIMNSDFLGFDPDRSLAYRDNNNNLLDGHESPETNLVYTASITYDEKG